MRPAGSAGWQAPVDLSAAGQDADYPQVAVDARGDAVAVWERSNGTNLIVQGAVRPAGSAGWQAPVDLSAAGQDARYPQVAVDPQGNAVAVWIRSNGTDYIVQGAVRPAGSGGWQAPADLSTAGQDADRPQVAVDPQGNAVAVWRRTNGTTMIVQGAVRPAGSGGWQAPADLSTAGQNAYEPQVAVDPQGNAVAVWRRSNGTNFIVQGAGYDAAGPLLHAVSIPAAGTAGRPVSFSVSPLDVWSALGASSWSFGDGASASGTSLTHTYAAAGRYDVTLTSADALGNATSASGTVAIAPAPPGRCPAGQTGTPPNCPTPPMLARVAQSHRAWRETKSRGRKHRAPIGTTFSFTLDQPATVRLAFTQRLRGRRVKGRCLAQTRQNRRTPGCRRMLTRSALSFPGRAGKNKIAFRGRITGSKKLKPGKYTLIITATNAARQRSQPQRLSFTIVK